MARTKVYQLTKAKYLNELEQAELWRWLEANKLNRDAILIELGLVTGGRENELLAVTPADLSNGTVHICGLKGSLDREIPLKPDLYKRLLNLSKGLAPSERIFGISDRRVRQIWDKVRPGNKKFHSLRHTFGLNLYAKTRDLRLTQMALGHTNIQNTMIYAHVAEGLDLLKKALL